MGGGERPTLKPAEENSHSIFESKYNLLYGNDGIVTTPQPKGAQNSKIDSNIPYKLHKPVRLPNTKIDSTKTGEDLHYAVYILSSDISKEDITKLTGILESGNTDNKKHFSLTYIDMSDFDLTKRYPEISFAHHFTKEMLYKLLVPDLFPQFTRVLISDVDIIYLDDIYYYFDFEVPNIYAGCGAEGYIDAGFVIANVKWMRYEGVQAKMLEYLGANHQNLMFMEEAVMNAVGAPSFILPKTCMKRNNVLDNDTNFTLIHYIKGLRDYEISGVDITALGYKPFYIPNMMHASAYYRALASTPYLEANLLGIERRIMDATGGRLLILLLILRIKKRLKNEWKAFKARYLG